MAIYGKQRYGEAIYGISSTHSGDYTSQIFDIGELATDNHLDLDLTVALPRATYLAQDVDIAYKGVWGMLGNYQETASYDASCIFAAAFKNLIISHELTSAHDDIKITLEKYIDGILISQNDYLIDSSTPIWDATALTSQYAEYRLIIRKANNNSKPIRINYIECQPVDIKIEGRLGVKTNEVITWDEWASPAVTSNYISAFDYLLNSSFTSSATAQVFQSKLTLVSSDDAYSPAVYKFEASCSTAREGNGSWEMVIMFATGEGATYPFKEYGTINWNVSDESKVKIRTASSINGSDWTNLSHPYVSGGNSQLRLKDGFLTGSILTNEISYTNAQSWIAYKTNDNYDSSRDELNKIIYELLIFSGTEYITLPMNTLYKPQPEYTALADNGAKIKLRINLSRANLAVPTPYVNKIEAKCRCQYEELKNVECYISSLTNNFTGQDELTVIEALGFNIPTDIPVPNVEYNWINDTGKDFINLYWKNQDSFFDKATSKSYNVKDTLCIRCKESTANPIHRVNSSVVVIGTYLKSLSLKNKQFSPALKENTSYDYYATDGRLVTDYKVSANTTKNRVPSNLNWSLNTLWTTTGNITWDKNYRAWKCVGECSFYLANALSYNSASKYVGGIKALTFDSNVVISWGCKQLGTDSTYIATNNFIANNVTIAKGEWTNYEGNLVEGGQNTKSLIVGGTIVQANEAVTYIRDISFFDTLEGRIIDIYWEGQDTSLAKYKWNMVTSTLDTKLCFSIYAFGEADALWTSNELILYNKVVNKDHIKNNYKVILDALPNIPPYVKCENQPYYITINKNAVYQGNKRVDSSRITLWDSASDSKIEDETSLIDKDITTVWNLQVNFVLAKDDNFEVTYQGDLNRLPRNKVTEVKIFYDIDKTTEYQVGVGKDYQLIRDEDNNYIQEIVWLADLDIGQKYYMEITYLKPSSALVEFACDYNEVIPKRELWTSIETITRAGTLSEGQQNFDYDLPAIKFDKNSANYLDFSDISKLFPSILENDVLRILPESFYYSITNNNEHVTSVIEGKTNNTIAYYQEIWKAEAKKGQAAAMAEALNKIEELRKKYGYSGSTEGTYAYLETIKLKDIAVDTIISKTKYIRNSMETNLAIKWNPSIHNGYYYVGDQRYYKYTKPVIEKIEPSTKYGHNETVLTSAPNLDAPLIVVKSDGTPLRKVSFMDSITGEYKLSNQEKIVWDRTHKDGYAKFKVSYTDLDIDNFETILYNYTNVVASSNTPLLDGKLQNGGLLIDGNTILVKVADESILYTDAYLSILYKPNHCFIYNPNTNKITLDKEYEETISIYYESSTDNYSDIDIDINPMFNSNHNGFLYLAKEDRAVAQFDIRLSKQKMKADGKSFAYINIIPLDYNGNPINSSNLTVLIDNKDYNSGYLSSLTQLGFGEYFCIYTSPSITIPNGVTQTKYVYITIKDGNMAVKKKIELISV
jgi:hypothetical protein